MTGKMASIDNLLKGETDALLYISEMDGLVSASPKTGIYYMAEFKEKINYKGIKKHLKSGNAVLPENKRSNHIEEESSVDIPIEQE